MDLEVSPWWKTPEFWLSLVAQIGAVAVAFGWFDQSQVDATNRFIGQLVAAISQLLAGLGFTVMRTRVKVGVLNAISNQPTKPQGLLGSSPRRMAFILAFISLALVSGSASAAPPRFMTDVPPQFMIDLEAPAAVDDNWEWKKYLSSAELAIRENKPLVVQVGYVSRECVPGAICVHVGQLEGYKSGEIVVAYPDLGRLYYDKSYDSAKDVKLRKLTSTGCETGKCRYSYFPTPQALGISGACVGASCSGAASCGAGGNCSNCAACSATSVNQPAQRMPRGQSYAFVNGQWLPLAPEFFQRTRGNVSGGNCPTCPR